jgi:hypothetical protein
MNGQTHGATLTEFDCDGVTHTNVNLHPSVHPSDAECKRTVFVSDGETCIGVYWTIRTERHVGESYGTNARTDVGQILNVEQARAMRDVLDKAIAEAEAPSVCPRPEPACETPAAHPRRPAFETLSYTGADRAPETARERSERSEAYGQERAHAQRAFDGLNVHDRATVRAQRVAWAMPALDEREGCDECEGPIDTAGETCRDCETQLAVEAADLAGDLARGK